MMIEVCDLSFQHGCRKEEVQIVNDFHHGSRPRSFACDIGKAMLISSAIYTEDHGETMILEAAVLTSLLDSSHQQCHDVEVHSTNSLCPQ